MNNENKNPNVEEELKKQSQEAAEKRTGRSSESHRRAERQIPASVC